MPQTDEKQATQKCPRASLHIFLIFAILHLFRNRRNTNIWLYPNGLVTHRPKPIPSPPNLTAKNHKDWCQFSAFFLATCEQPKIWLPKSSAAFLT